jgi:sestrin
MHGLCSFVLGCGVAGELDMVGGTRQRGLSLPDVQTIAEGDADLETQTEQLIKRLKEADEVHQPDPKVNRVQENKQIFEHCESQDSFNTTTAQAVAAAQAAEEGSHFPEKPINFIFEDISRFLGDAEMAHVDFDFKAQDYSVFRLQDYSWEEHGCALVSELLPGTGELLDEEFNSILNLTDYSLFNTRQEANEQVDTWPFRQAIWYYVLRLAGMSHDDYNYHEVNIYLNKRIKQYIKKVACYPETIVPSDFRRMGFTFRPDEKCQINLLAAEARKLAELLYTLHAVMQYTR